MGFMGSKSRVVLAGMVGTILEFYDYALYGVFSLIIAERFFPSGDPKAALLMTFATFAVGYFGRPAGALIFGHIGDRWGRRSSLMWSIILMAIPTFLMGLIPTYEKVGLIAPVFLVLCRLLQGICAGGEYNGGAIFVIEHLDRKRGGRASSSISFSASVGTLSAMFMGAFFLQTWMPEWAWRIPFLFGGVLGIVGIYLRLKVGETPAFEGVVESKEIVDFPFIEVIKKHYKPIFFCFFATGLFGVLGQTCFSYMHVYVTKVAGVSLQKSLFYNSVGLVSYLFAAPVAGILYDRFGYKVMAIAAAGVSLVAFPAFIFIKTGVRVNIISVQVVLCLFMAGFCAPFNVFMSYLFPANARYTGLTLGYGLGMAFFGGTTPLVYTYIMDLTSSPLAPAVYLMVASGMGVFGILMGKKYFRDDREDEKLKAPDIHLRKAA